MSLDLRLQDTWEEQNKWIRSALGVEDPQVNVGLYHGLGHALLDTLYGIKEFWSIKKIVVVITDGDPYLLSCLRTFVRENYEIKKIQSKDITDVDQWVKSLRTDVLGVIYSADHAFTGEKLNSEELAAKLSERKIYSIEIQHQIHAYHKKEVGKWMVHVQNFFPDFAVVLHGPRIKMFQHSAFLMDWSHRDFSKDLSLWSEAGFENKNLVQNFEYQLKQNPQLAVTPYFSQSFEKRLWDRTIIQFSHLAGDEFIHQLAQKLGIKLADVGFESRIETTHFCRWKVFEDYEWWGTGIKSRNEFRSLVTISTHILQRPHFFETFSEVVSSCQRDSQLI